MKLQRFSYVILYIVDFGVKNCNGKAPEAPIARNNGHVIHVDDNVGVADL